MSFRRKVNKVVEEAKVDINHPLQDFKEAVIFLAAHDGVRMAEISCEAVLDLLRDPDSGLRRQIAALTEDMDDISSL